ncbi:hypothetical protein [Aurantiacibacter gilvus]|uniref:Methanethiol oxidase n=1 Tax=Aurantiacibacter gilvus TaxID=3139141 RepID=A0ABU9IC80_9SPHN
MLRRILVLLLALPALAIPVHSQASDHTGKYLFVWAGDPADEGNDFIVVINADPDSADYGSVVSSEASDQQSVNAHHTEYEMPASGMLFANDHEANRTIIFDLTNPLQPRQAGAFTSLGGYSMPHSFARLPNGNVLATFQHTEHHADMKMPVMSGGIVEIDDSGAMVRSVSNADPAFADEGLLPYGLAVLPELDRVLVTNSPMSNDWLMTSNTYQVFRLSDLELLGTHRLDPGPRLNGHISPEEPRVGPDGAVYVHTLSCGVQRVTGLDSPAPNAQLVHQYPGNWCGVPTIMGRYMVQAAPDIHAFFVLDISDGAEPVEVSRLDMGEDFVPHWTAWDPDIRRLVVTPGSSGQRMYLLELDDATGTLTIDDTFRGEDGEVGFSFASRTWPHGWTGEGAPHGAVFSR